jgi:hypothetical protein
MKTIFAGNRKRLRFPTYISVFEVVGRGVEYQRQYGREDRARFDGGSCKPQHVYWYGNPPVEMRHLYRINVYPKECPT